MYLNTYDIYASLKEVDIWLIQEPHPNTLKFIFKSPINPRKVILILHEPPVVNPWAWRFLKYYSWLFKVILTWQSDLCKKNRKFFHYHFPVKIDKAKYPY
jgi:hypothetical protein